MLKSVKRRFGVSKDGQDRPATYLEALLTDTFSRVVERLSEDSERDPFVETAKLVVQLESRRERCEEPDLTDDTVLGAVTAYLQLLLDNDGLPPDGQLGDEDLATTRTLLLSAAIGSDSTATESERVLSLLEEKFNSGKFTQASLLLRLFETTTVRERNNERTLFYEEMFSRFGVIRLNRIPGNLCRKYRDALQKRTSPSEGILDAAVWLKQNAGVHLSVAVRDPGDIDTWSRLFRLASGDVAAYQDLIPPRRWRNVSEFADLGVIPAITNQLEGGALLAYFGHLLKVCYFIVLVTGKTGFEPFIKTYFDWVESHFDVVGTNLLPGLHYETTVGERSLGDAVEEILTEKMMPAAGRIRETLDEATLEAALEALLEDLIPLDPNEIPPGDYDLGGLVLDRATGLDVIDPVALFRIHRIC